MGKGQRRFLVLSGFKDGPPKACLQADENDPR